jgi:surface-anchored protein
LKNLWPTVLAYPEMKNRPTIMICLLTILSVVGTASAQPYLLTGGHADVNLEFDGANLEIGFHTEFTGGMTTITGGAPQQNEFETADLTVNVPIGTTTARPAVTEFDAIGVPGGQRINVMPQTEEASEVAGVVRLGWAAEELTAADWTGDLTWTLTGVTGPGTFSVYESGLTPTFRMASSDGISAADAFTIEAGHHEHFNLGFSTPGTYQVQLNVSGTHNTAGAVNTTGTLTFDVAATPFRINGGHADVNLEFDGAELEVGFHTEFTGGMTEISGGAPQQNEFEAADIIINVPTGTTTTRPTDAGFDPIGVPGGQRINVMPQTEEASETAGVVRLGWAAEELTAADWSGDLNWTLSGVTGPGTFSVYESGLTPNFHMASADGLTAGDSFSIEAGHHEHFNLGFSAPGTYQIQLNVAGTHNTAGAVNGTSTLTFDVAATPFRLTGGHADVNLEFDGSELEVGFHTEFTGGHTEITGGAPQQNEFAASDIIINVPTGTTTTRPAGAEFDPIGIPAGQRMNIMPQTESESEAAGVVRLGWAAEELMAGDWTGDLNWTLTGVTGPGAFSVYKSGLTPTFNMASSDGVSAADVFTVEAGHHEHFNLGFSQPGKYQVQVAVAGTHNTAGVVSSTSTLTFDVAADPFQLTGGHGDVNLELDGNQLEIGFHTEFTGGMTTITGGAPQQNEFEAEDLHVVVPASTLIARPSGSEWDPTGASSGAAVFVLPQTENASETAGAVFLGWAAEELTAGDWNGDIAWTLNSVSGPGHFSVYQAGLTPTFRMSSADGVSAADNFTVEAGHHEHFNLGFSAPGNYQLNLTAAGMHNTLGAVSGSGTLTFLVQAPPVPATVNVATFTSALPGAVLAPDGSLMLSIPAGAVTGDGLTYQWQLDGVDIPGASGATLSATGAVPGNYRFVVNGSTGPAATSPNVPVLRVTQVFVAGVKVEGPTGGLNLMLESSEAINAPTVFAPVNGAQAVPDGNILRLLDVNRDPATIGSRFFRIGIQQPQP